jgi:hypothetical protein
VELFGYLIFVFGVVGIGLGLYGLFKPALRSESLASLVTAVRARMRPPEENDGYDETDVVEIASFRNKVPEERSLAAVQSAPPGAVPLPQPPPPAVRRVQLETSVEPAEQPTASALAPLDAAPPPLLESPAPLDSEPEESMLEAVEVITALEEEDVDSALPEPAEPAVHSDDDASGILALFEEAAVTSKLPSALRDAIPEVRIEDLLAEARALRQVFDPGGAKTPAA